MAKSKHRKNHKKKLNERKENIENTKKRMEKMKREFIKNLIEQEKNKGMFDNMPEGPTVDGPLNNDGSIVDGPSI
jgi:hypothetical protein